MDLSAADHVFCPGFPVPHNQLRDTGTVRFDENRSCDRESGASQPDFHVAEGRLLLVVRSIDDRNGCTGMRLSISHPEELHRERPESQLYQPGVSHILTSTHTVHDPQVNI
jgi:hypothetical protein